jgi:hypothetical protein
MRPIAPACKLRKEAGQSLDTVNEIMSQQETYGDTSTLVDGHVHIHDGLAVAWLLDSALSNFKQAAHEQDASWPCRMILLLTETSSAHEFHKLRTCAMKQAGEALVGQWRLSPTEEERSLNACRSTGEQISIVAGRQIVTREKLEVLALCTEAEFPDGEPIAASIKRAAECGAVVVLPWGFGKWVGKRGQIIRELLRSHNTPAFHIGDNSGRLKFWPTPREFSIAEKRGLHILPGSDPLPFPREADRVGRFGFSLPLPISFDQPGADLIVQLSNPDIQPLRYGRCEGLARFLKNQAAMQLVKRRPRKPPEALPRGPTSS